MKWFNKESAEEKKENEDKIKKIKPNWREERLRKIKHILIYKDYDLLQQMID